ncbi:MAG: hypothetical protein DCC43_14660 [Candidatus Brocadia sp.]|nr:hypothetical protein [Candidatus Brocadia sp. AMX3]RIJ90770.1 MAG: hypothetical protein DCC43_14660 [Candidatus Brocadia sp.]
MHRISIFLLLPYTPPTPLKRGQKKSPPGKGFWGGFNLIIKVAEGLIQSVTTSYLHRNMPEKKKS